MAISKEELSKALNWRYATKAYDSTKKVSDEDWQALKEAMLMAPSSYGLQAYKVVVVEDSGLRARLREAAYGQAQVTDASHFVVFAAKTELDAKDVARFIDRNAEVRGVDRESLAQLEGMVAGSVAAANASNRVTEWNARQAYVSLGFLLESAALLGIDASPMEGFDPAAFDRILELDGYTSVVIAALGYRNAESDWLAPLAKVRWKHEDFFDVR